MRYWTVLLSVVTLQLREVGFLKLTGLLFLIEMNAFLSVIRWNFIPVAACKSLYLSCATGIIVYHLTF